MDLQHLRALVVVAETGSVTAAARRLLLTQPAVTKQLSALEGELGGALFDRTRKPLPLVSATQTPLTGMVAIEALRGHAWVMSRSGCGYRAVLKRTLEAAGIPFTVAVEVLETELQLQLIRAGIGVGIILRRALPPRLQRTGLQTFTVADL